MLWIHEHDSHVRVVIDEQSSPRLPNDTCKVASGLAIPAIPATAQEVPNPLRDQQEDLLKPLSPQGNSAQQRYPAWPKSYDASLRVSWRRVQPTDPPHKKLDRTV